MGSLACFVNQAADDDDEDDEEDDDDDMGDFVVELLKWILK
jgi:hypothetical protein